MSPSAALWRNSIGPTVSGARSNLIGLSVVAGMEPVISPLLAGCIWPKLDGSGLPVEANRVGGIGVVSIGVAKAVLDIAAGLIEPVCVSSTIEITRGSVG